jgi:hypothetical protein
MNEVHNDHEHEPVIFLEIIKDFFMNEVYNDNKHEPIKADELNAKKYSLEIQRTNHHICQNKWSLIHMLHID